MLTLSQGVANNQLLKEYHDQMLFEKNILYVPDYVINSGGIVCVGYEFFRRSGINPGNFELDRDTMVKHVERVGPIVANILSTAKRQGNSTRRGSRFTCRGEII